MPRQLKLRCELCSDVIEKHYNDNVKPVSCSCKNATLAYGGCFQGIYAEGGDRTKITVWDYEKSDWGSLWMQPDDENSKKYLTFMCVNMGVIDGLLKRHTFDEAMTINEANVYLKNNRITCDDGRLERVKFGIE